MQRGVRRVEWTGNNLQGFNSCSSGWGACWPYEGSVHAMGTLIDHPLLGAMESLAGGNGIENVMQLWS